MQPQFAEQIVEEFEKGQLSRRQLVARLMGLGAVMAIVPEAAQASQDGKPTLQAKGLNHIALNVRDLKKSAEFYETHLGLKVVHKQGDFLWVLGRSNDDRFLALFRNDHPGLSHYAYTIENFDPDEVVRKLNAAGIKHRRERHGIYFNDPDGLVVQVSGPNPEG
jgi:catechol 2,3-dioxygenase-like lactoylglutathione lyase family enzyme